VRELEAKGYELSSMWGPWGMFAYGSLKNDPTRFCLHVPDGEVREGSWEEMEDFVLEKHPSANRDINEFGNVIGWPSSEPCPPSFGVPIQPENLLEFWWRSVYRWASGFRVEGALERWVEICRAVDAGEITLGIELPDA